MSESNLPIGSIVAATVAKFKNGDYVSVINTRDEWEDLIGIVEEFMDPEGVIKNDYEEGDRIVVFFPFTCDDIKEAKLEGLNYFNSFVKAHLRKHEGKQVFEPKNLESFDKEEL